MAASVVNPDASAADSVRAAPGSLRRRSAGRIGVFGPGVGIRLEKENSVGSFYPPVNSPADVESQFAAMLRRVIGSVRRRRPGR